MSARITNKDLVAQIDTLTQRLDTASRCMAAQMARITELERFSHKHAATKR
jgi:hypothetical protein